MKGIYGISDYFNLKKNREYIRKFDLNSEKNYKEIE